MKLRHSLLALVVASAVATPAFAWGDDADLYNLTIAADLSVTAGAIDVDGDIAVASKSSAVVDQDQETVGNVSVGDGDHIADLTGDALSDARGNIGANVSAGVGNAQANDAALSAVDGNRVFASAMVFNSQLTDFNFAGTLSGDTNYSATLDEDALSDARGNIGVNVAAGVGNGQTNGMAASVNTSGRYAIASADSEQSTYDNTLQSLFGDLDVYAYFGGNALENAQGNIAVNVTAGIGNLQHNGLSIASATGD